MKLFTLELTYWLVIARALWIVVFDPWGER